VPEAIVMVEVLTASYAQAYQAYSALGILVASTLPGDSALAVQASEVPAAGGPNLRLLQNGFTSALGRQGVAVPAGLEALVVQPPSISNAVPSPAGGAGGAGARASKSTQYMHSATTWVDAEVRMTFVAGAGSLPGSAAPFARHADTLGTEAAFAAALQASVLMDPADAAALRVEVLSATVYRSMASVRLVMGLRTPTLAKSTEKTIGARCTPGFNVRGVLVPCMDFTSLLSDGLRKQPMGAAALPAGRSQFVSLVVSKVLTVATPAIGCAQLFNCSLGLAAQGAAAAVRAAAAAEEERARKEQEALDAELGLTGAIAIALGVAVAIAIAGGLYMLKQRNENRTKARRRHRAQQLQAQRLQEERREYEMERFDGVDGEDGFDPDGLRREQGGLPSHDVASFLRKVSMVPGGHAALARAQPGSGLDALGYDGAADDDELDAHERELRRLGLLGEEDGEDGYPGEGGEGEGEDYNFLPADYAEQPLMRLPPLSWKTVHVECRVVRGPDWRKVRKASGKAAPARVALLARWCAAVFAACHCTPSLTLTFPLLVGFAYQHPPYHPSAPPPPPAPPHRATRTEGRARAARCKDSSWRTVPSTPCPRCWPRTR
jgi:hypothetical protein